MFHFPKHPRTILVMGALGLLALGLFSGGVTTAHAQAKEKKKPSAKNEIPPPPEDINELSMEVAVLRKLYLLNAGEYQLKVARSQGRQAAQKDKDASEGKPRKRQEADISPNFRKVLTELRAAFIAGQEDRIDDLSEQLDELTKEEDPDLDDEVDVTRGGRRHAPTFLSAFEADAIVRYLAAYGKDLPSPRKLLAQTMRLDGKGKKPTPEQWKEIRAFTIREVSWMLGGIDLEKAKPQKIGEKVGALLDEAYALSDEELKDPKQKAKLVNGINRIAFLPPTEILKHVIEQDLAEMLSNPRLGPAVEARLKFLAQEAKKVAAK